MALESLEVKISNFMDIYGFCLFEGLTPIFWQIYCYKSIADSMLITLKSESIYFSKNIDARVSRNFERVISA